MLSDQTQAGDGLDRAIGVLASEFVGVFAPETVDHCVRDSYRQLAERATVATYLPLLSQRFARERLHAAHRALDAAADRAGVLFVCSHNAGRSQIAAGWLAHLAPELDVWSAGTDPGHEVSRFVIEVMGEVGIDLATAYPKPLTDEVVGAAAVVVTMGCGEACPVVPGRRYEDWILARPIGDTIESARSARDEIRERVEALIGSLRPVAA